MPAQRIAQQPVARQTVEALEPLAHVRGPRRQIDPCRRPPAEHAHSRSSTPINCAKVWASNPRPISIRRPLGKATARPLPARPSSTGRPADSFTSTQRFPAAGLPCVCRFRYRASVAKASPCSRQNSTWLNPRASYSATNCPASARLRRRRTSTTCVCSSTLSLNHERRREERWVALTLTLDQAFWGDRD